MKANALICEDGKRVALREVALPELGPQHIVARTLCSGVSVGTESLLVRGKVDWGRPLPICLGYQAVGVVEDVGADVSGYAVGDRIYYRGSREMVLPDGAPVTCAEGAHCDRAVIDPNATHGVDHLPDGVSDEVSSLYVMPSVGLHGVDTAEPKVGDLAVVYGCGLVGLGVVAALRLRGAEVVAVDIAADRLDAARRLGADHLIDASSQDVKAQIEQLDPDGADIVFEATGIPKCVNEAMQLCRRDATFVFQGNYGSDLLPWDFMTAHSKRLHIRMPADDGLEPCRRAVMRNIASGALPWGEVITHRLSPQQCAEFYNQMLSGKLDGVIGAVIRWSEP